MTADLESAGDPFGDAVPGTTEWVSPWLRITQSMIDQFAEATLESDPMHDDPAWAKDNMPQGVTIAYGFQTVSLMSYLMKQATGAPETIISNAAGSMLNYGFDRLRMVSPVPVESRIRGRFTLVGRETDEKGRILQRTNAVVELENQDRPAVVAEWLSLWVPARG